MRGNDNYIVISIRGVTFTILQLTPFSLLSKGENMPSKTNRRILTGEANIVMRGAFDVLLSCCHLSQGGNCWSIGVNDFNHRKKRTSDYITRTGEGENNKI